MLVISSRISGWRVTDSITLPKMIPMPTPAPTAPRPPPIPIPRPAPTPDEAANGMRCASTVLCSFWLVMADRATEVDGRQCGEDEGLQRGHQTEFEEVHQDSDRQGEPAEEAEPEDDRQPAGHEQEDQVAGQ